MKHLLFFIIIIFCLIHNGFAHVGVYPYDTEFFLEQDSMIDIMYPQYSLCQVQKIALQLLDDLELLMKEPHQILSSCAVDTDYIVNLCKSLYEYVKKIVFEEVKTHYYLPDDIEYVVEVCLLVEKKIMHTLPCVCSDSPSQFIKICSYIVDSRIMIDSFFNDNILKNK